MVRVSVIDDTRQRKCDAGCGVDWSSPEVVEVARRRLQERFGGGVTLSYLDLAGGEAAPGWPEAIRERNLPVPLLLVNGHLRIAGQFDVRRVLDAVEAEMEIET